MPAQWETIWRFSTARFSIHLDCAHDPYMDLSWDEDGEATRNINAGIWGHYQFRVAVRINGVLIGTDYLGGCIYADPMGFRGDGYFRDMVRQAIKDARAFLGAMPTLRNAA